MSALFLRIFQHLLPRSRAWILTLTTKYLRKLFEGLSEPFEDAREFIDSVHAELLPATTTSLDEWESHFGITANSADTDGVRRTRLAAEWQAQGGQDPDYIETVLQAAGFDLYVHEWWSNARTPWTARDPRSYTTQPQIGDCQCYLTADAYQPQCCDGTDATTLLAIYQWQCSNTLVNWTGYLVNRDLTDRAPPPVPEDESRWPHFLYIGQASLASGPALIPQSRRADLERLVLKLCPMQDWIVLYVDWTYDGIFDESFDLPFN